LTGRKPKVTGKPVKYTNNIASKFTTGYIT